MVSPVQSIGKGKHRGRTVPPSAVTVCGIIPTLSASSLRRLERRRLRQEGNKYTARASGLFLAGGWRVHPVSGMTSEDFRKWYVLVSPVQSIAEYRERTVPPSAMTLCGIIPILSNSSLRRLERRRGRQEGSKYTARASGLFLASGWRVRA